MFFLSFCFNFSSCSVVCCRVTPLQKAQIVQLVRDNKPDGMKNKHE